MKTLFITLSLFLTCLLNTGDLSVEKQHHEKCCEIGNFNGLDEAKKKAKQKVASYARSLKGKRNAPTIVTAVVHIRTLKVYYGRSGSPIPSKVHKTLENALPKTSKESWVVKNCAEVKAYDNALSAHPGAKLNHFVEVSAYVSNSKIRKPCKNCKQWVPYK